MKEYPPPLPSPRPAAPSPVTPRPPRHPYTRPSLTLHQKIPHPPPTWNGRVFLAPGVVSGLVSMATGVASRSLPAASFDCFQGFSDHLQWKVAVIYFKGCHRQSYSSLRDKCVFDLHALCTHCSSTTYNIPILLKQHIKQQIF
ncbi:unnamed protein product [Danaus chrysippus]|uniref:(African queen) hypothetical protein n=1 Tax=Danaus chrysippus TaxID=151541 RepID=A0A8J2QVP6_9NEOP|nr:unnamed protein product [Danaus chrysippus]